MADVVSALSALERAPEKTTKKGSMYNWFIYNGVVYPAPAVQDSGLNTEIAEETVEYEGKEEYQVEGSEKETFDLTFGQNTMEARNLPRDLRGTEVGILKVEAKEIDGKAIMLYMPKAKINPSTSFKPTDGNVGMSFNLNAVSTQQALDLSTLTTLTDSPFDFSGASLITVENGERWGRTTVTLT